jgi:alpha-L-fucosidase
MTPAPKPYGPTPSKAQLIWHEREIYGFIHFTINTFTDKEWGYGDEDPALFNPTDFSAEQIVTVAKKGGLKGLILTAKHHDGFCLWPTKTTAHSIQHSPYKEGKGDIVKEVSEACRKHGLLFGVYLSPWDRNHAEYGKPGYVKTYHAQMRELLTHYGTIFEIWHDGANGGDGYYGGARETRKINAATYYDWDRLWQMEHKLQPTAARFSDLGPEIRWVGNERGIAGDPCWATFTPVGNAGGQAAPGDIRTDDSPTGNRNGKFWIPAECDVSIRPGWFYHANEDSKVKTPEALWELYFASVGRGASFLLNLPPDRRGQIHENDVASLTALGERLQKLYATDYMRGAKATASSVRGNDQRYHPSGLVDGRRATYWATEEGVTSAEVSLELAGEKTFNIVRLEEAISLGQRIDKFAIDIWQNGEWEVFGEGTSIGAHRLLRGKTVTTSRVRLRVLEAAASPCVREMNLYLDQ